MLMLKQSVDFSGVHAFRVRLHVLAENDGVAYLHENPRPRGETDDVALELDSHIVHEGPCELSANTDTAICASPMHYRLGTMAGVARQAHPLPFGQPTSRRDYLRNLKLLRRRNRPFEVDSRHETSDRLCGGLGYGEGCIA